MVVLAVRIWKNTMLAALLGSFALLVCCALEPEIALANGCETLVPEANQKWLIDGRSWYGGSCAFTRTWVSAERYFDGSSVGIEMNVQSSKTGAFDIQLYKNGCLVGSKQVTKNGSVRVTWENVGSGKFFFRFVNGTGEQITCSDIAMFSW